ncbi:MAG: hypothetical protein ABSF26_12745 [Thermoguttaceae bacterium]|jgi:hypothetical protein
MAEEIELPPLVMKTAKCEFRLRCHAAAWSSGYGGRMKMRRRYGHECPGLLLLSATGPDTSVKSVRASLYQPDVQAEFVLESEPTERLLKARITFDGKPVTYTAAVSKLAPGVVHLVALAKIPGLMPDMSDDHLWAELTGPRYTTPLLRAWIPWLKTTMAQGGGIVVANGFESTVGVLKTEPDELDALVTLGVKEGYLRMVA